MADRCIKEMRREKGKNFFRDSIQGRGRNAAGIPLHFGVVGDGEAGHVKGMAIKAVLFDFDGVLVDTEWAIYQAWLATFQAAGHDLPLEIYTRCIGSDFETWSPKIHLEELTGESFDWHDLDVRRQERIVADLAGQGAMPGVDVLLERLEANGIPKAVVSSSSHHWVDGWLEKIDRFDRFQTIVCRGDAPRIKPAPDLYLEAARRLECDPVECLVIEDSLNGVRAAKAAGMTAWVVPNRVTEGLDFSSADRVFASLEEVGEFVRNGAATKMACDDLA